jgi:hypothetical protein
MIPRPPCAKMKAWTAWFFSILLLAASTAGAEPVEPLAEGDTVSATGCIAEIGLADARSADELGLPSISVRLYASLFRDNPGLASREELVRAYSDALLNSGDAASAETFLASHSFADSPWWRLSLSLCMLERGDAAGASALLQPATDFASLDARRMPWFHLANGLVRARMGDSRGASENYARAMEGAVDEALRSQISLLMLREQLENGRADSIVVTDLRQRVKDMQGQRGGFEAGRLLAVALYQMDRPTEALSVLDEQLRYIGVDEGSTRGQILLLVAYIAGPDSGRGRSAIQQILVNASLPSELLENALEMLVSDSRTPSTTIRGVLDGVISTSPRHPLMDRLLLIRSRLSLDEGRLDDSVADAQRVIDQFPASKLRGTALRMLAYVAFNRQPPQYRTVASFLSLLRSELPEGPERAGLGLIIADCFFLDTDYASAATAYADAFEEVGENRGGILYQMVLSRIRDGQTDGARADLDRFGAAHGVDSMHRWRAEWNLVQSMRARGLAGSARERVNMLLTGGAAENLGAELRLRLMWLQAQLELDDGEAASVPASCRTILDTIGTLPDDVLAPDQRALLSSHALLLMGQAHLAMDNEADASTAFGILRAQHPESMAARNSYLVQSRWLFSHERLVEAQHQLLTLADRHPASAQAPIALWEAPWPRNRGGWTSRIVRPSPYSNASRAGIRRATLCSMPGSGRATSSAS